MTDETGLSTGCDKTMHIITRGETMASLPIVSQRAVAGLLLRYSLACQSEGIGPDDRGEESSAVDALVEEWAGQVRPDLAELEAR